MRISRALVVVALSLGGALAYVSSANANESPTVAWTAPANNSTVTGKISLKATATPASSGTSTIAKWCLTINGEDASNLNVASFIDVSGNERTANSYYTSSGCWFYDSLDSRKITLTYDTTKWESKSYTFAIKVTDSSGRESASPAWTITTANTGPTVAWTAPANNSTVTGKISLKATATPASSGTSTIAKWCLTINGEDASNLNVASFIDVSGNERTANSYYTSSGCWFYDSLDSRKITLTYDTTKWENKSYTFAIKVTDSSGRESASPAWTITTANTGPTVAWTAPANNSTVTGKISLKATATPASSGTSTIAKWCLTINGEDASNLNVASFIDVSGNERTANSYYTSSGCWFYDSLDSRKITLTYDTTKWENKSYTFAIKVTDSSGRESASPAWTITTANTGPTVAWTAPANNSTVTGKISLKATATPASSGTSTIAKWCLTINGEDASNLNVASFIDVSGNERTANSYYTSSGCWFYDSLDSRKITLTYDTTKWENKSYTFAIKVTDSTGRESTEAKWTFATNNPGPTITGTSSKGDAETRPSVSLTAKPNIDTEVTKWCVSFSQDSEIQILPSLIDSRGDELEEDSYQIEDNCFVPNSEVLKATFFLATEYAKNGKYSFEFWAYDENNHSSERFKFDYTLQDPGLEISLPEGGTLFLPGDFPTVQVDRQGGYRDIDQIQWSIDGKAIPGSSLTLNAKLNEVSPGAHTVSVKVIDTIGQSYTATKNYTMKWAPVLKFVDLEGYYWWTPASPAIKVKAYLGSAAWKGSHKATITYKNSSGKTVKQTFTIKNGSGAVTLQKLSKTTAVKVSVGATNGTVAASTEGTVELRKKPPAPVYTNISLGLPNLVIWPNAFNATVKVSGKGKYACTLTFQDFYTNFSVNAGSSKTVRVQPTFGINAAQRASVSCSSSYSSGYASDWLILSLQR